MNDKGGLDFFRDKYILIGGTACDLAMESMGLNFRATKDLDIVLILEDLDVEFVNAFWSFIKEGQYKNRQKSTGKKLFYRFYDPESVISKRFTTFDIEGHVWLF